MSSVLNRKKKKSVVGFNKSELGEMNAIDREKQWTEKIVKDTYHNMNVIAFVILHEKFGFGQKRMIRLNDTVNAYLEMNASKEINVHDVIRTLKETYDIDLRSPVKGMPHKDKCLFGTGKVPTKLLIQTVGLIDGTMMNHLAWYCMALKTQFKFSHRQIIEFIDWIAFYVNTVARYEQFGVSIDDLKLEIAEECKYVVA